MILKRIHIGVLMTLGPAIALVAACSADGNSMILVGDTCDGACAPPTFVTPDAGGDAEAGGPSEPRAMCIATECPAPYATCGNQYRCSTNLSTDSNNCGACGKVCPQQFSYLNLTSTCVNGTCEPTCAKELTGLGTVLEAYSDCNGLIEDGCEINITKDANNCGACGNKCADGVRCVEGKCGCPAGLTDCNGRCIDVRNDDFNCGECNKVCEPPTDAGPPKAHMTWGCVESECGKPKCERGFGDAWGNCDGDLENGCETFIGVFQELIDPKHCGSCNNACRPDQICSDIDVDLVPECSCTNPQDTRCGSPETGDLACADLLNDIQHCGTCFYQCPPPLPHMVAACRKGECETECAAGWGDCDGDPNNGCESNLASSDGNCGACGHRCDTQAGQPCINGQCAMTECDGGRGPQ